jgi:type II secretory pathway component PulK
MCVDQRAAGQIRTGNKLSPSERDDPKRGDRESGFALVFVVWCIGLLSLLFISYVVAARYRSLEGASLAARAEAEAFAQTAMRLAIFELLAGLNSEKLRTGRYHTNGAPLRCALGSRGHATISVGDEGGKVDLNTASPELVEALLEGVYDKGTADRLAKRIMGLRSVGSAAAGTSAANPLSADTGAHGPIRTVMELDQLAGAETHDWRVLLPLVTVHSQSPGIDPEVVSVQMHRVMVRLAKTDDKSTPNQAIPPEFAAPSPGRIFSVVVDVATDLRARSTWEAIVEFSLDMTNGYRIHESRKGSPNREQLPFQIADLPAC